MTGRLQVLRDKSTPRDLGLDLSGEWKSQRRLPDPAPVFENAEGIRRITVFAGELGEWDTGLLVFLADLSERCLREGITLDMANLPGGVRRLMRLSSEGPERSRSGHAAPPSLLFRTGQWAGAIFRDAYEIAEFMGETFLSLARFATGGARFRRSDLLLLLKETGPLALPIVTLISLLVGLILAFVSALQLKMFGAQIYVANLVGLGMAREMGAMMSAVIMAGRTGASFSAQIGTMQVNEEVDALRTLGISPMDFLVLPRLLALVLMMPLLCCYADLMGIVGGGLVGVGMLDIAPAQYLEQTRSAVTLADLSIGIFKSTIFGGLIAVSGCFTGMRCQRSASAVGGAATSAVVTAIVLIIVSDALITIICSMIGI